MQNFIRDKIIKSFSLLPLYLSPIIIIVIAGNYVGSELMHRKSILISFLFIIYLFFIGLNKFIFKNKLIIIIISMYILIASITVLNFNKFYLLYLESTSEQYKFNDLIFYAVSNRNGQKILYQETLRSHGCGIIINSNAYIDSALLGQNISINEISNFMDNDIKFVDRYKVEFYNSDELCVSIYYDSSGVGMYFCNKQQNIPCNYIGFLHNNQFVIVNHDEFYINKACMNTAVNNIFHNILTIK